ncbi:MAG: D-alanyl-D-alanine carboxypeptidase family protein [Evtepia sp.]
MKDLTSDSSTANLKAGEEITVHDLLYCLMLASANEAANILAMTVCRDIPTFVERMNQRAQELGMTGTHFMNPHGLHNGEHYSTARDIYRMAKEAMTHAAFREIVSTARYVVPATNMSGERVLLNATHLLTSAKFPGYTFSRDHRHQDRQHRRGRLLSRRRRQKKGHTLVSMVLGAEQPHRGQRQGPAQAVCPRLQRLMTWGFESFSPATPAGREAHLKEIPVRFSTESTHVLVQPTQSVTAMVPGEYDASRLELRVKLKEDTATAPIEEGGCLGDDHRDLRRGGLRDGRSGRGEQRVLLSVPGLCLQREHRAEEYPMSVCSS